jgi:CubicO group peptidase (beta-lactamase class C family)
MSDFYKNLNDLILASTDDAELTTPAAVLKDLGTPTASIAVLDHGDITSHCITTRSEDTETLFQACSISKPTAGVAAMALVDEGLFTPDSLIKDLLPDSMTALLSRDPKTVAAFDTVTVAHLMSHTAGLSVPSFPGYAPDTTTPSITVILLGHGNTMRIRFCSVPGAELIYSGGSTTLLQCILENVTGLPLPQIMQKYVFDPLEMTRSFYALPEGETNVTRCFMHGSYETDFKWHNQPEQAAAGIWTTPTDLLKLVRGMHASLDGKGILRQETAELMLTRRTPNIGLGFFVGDNAFVHGGGNMPGWICYVLGYADLKQNRKTDSNSRVVENCGIAVMTNSI